MLSSPKQEALEVSAGQLVPYGHGPNGAEGSPVKSRLVPSGCRFVTKPIYPREVSGYKRLGQIFSAGDDVRRSDFRIVAFDRSLSRNAA